MKQKKLITVLVLTVTLVLTLIAIFTAFKLYQVGKKPVATPTPIVKPKTTKETSPEPETPQVFQAQGEGVCELAFNTEATPTPTPTATPTETPTSTPTATPTTTPTATPEIGCWDICDNDSQCGVWSCQQVNGAYRCVNPSCPEESDCTCPGATPTPTPPPGTTPPTLPPGATPTLPPGATPAPELPSAGVVSPTIAFGLGGLLLILLGLLF